MPSPKDRDWSKLPADILYSISIRLLSLDFADYLSMGKVCSSWRSSMADMPNLIFIPSYNYVQYKAYNVMENTDRMSCYDFNLPYLHNKWCLGCQDGWLIVLDELNDVMALYNPITAQEIGLPSGYGFDRVDLCKAIVVWSKDDAPIVVVIAADRSVLTFARAGDESWVEKTILCRGTYEDVCCVDGKVFVLHQDSGSVFSVQLNDRSFVEAELVAVVSDAVRNEDWRNYIVAFGDTFLCVSRCLSDVGDDVNRVVVEKRDVKRNVWITLKDLDGWSVFLGNLSSVSLSTPELISGSKKNVIYFDDNSYDYGHGWTEGFEIGVFDMEDESYKAFKLPNPLPKTDSSLWFVPSMTKRMCRMTRIGALGSESELEHKRRLTVQEPH